MRPQDIPGSIPATVDPDQDRARRAGEAHDIRPDRAGTFRPVVVQDPVEQRILQLTPSQLATVRATFGEDDLDQVDPDEVIDLCDRLGEYITFAQYQARRRSRRRAAKRS